MKISFRKQAVQYAVLVISIGIIVKYFVDHKDELRQVFNLQGKDIILVSLLGLCIHIIMGYKMLFILRKLGLTEMPHLPWLKVFTVSRFLNFHLLQGGNIYRSIRLKQEYAFSYTDSLGMMAIFSWFEAVFILIISIVMVGFLDRGILIANVHALTVLGILLIVFFLLPFVIRVLLWQWRTKISGKIWIYEKLTQVTESLTANIRDVRLLVSLFALSLLTFLLYVWQINTVFQAIGKPIGIAETAVFVALTLLSGIINVTPGNIGVVELMYGYLSKVMGKTMGSGILVCGILRVLGYLIVVMCAVVFSQLGSTKSKQQNKF